MSTRSIFVKSELDNINNNLKMSYENTTFYRMENDTPFLKIFELIMELKEKTIILNNIIKGNTTSTRREVGGLKCGNYDCSYDSYFQFYSDKRLRSLSK